MSKTNESPVEKNTPATETKVAAKPVLHDFYVRKYDRTVKAATASEAVKLAKKLSKKEDK